MKAAVHTTYGPPTVIHIEDIPKPTPNPDEVLIEVHATTVNRTDIGFLRADPFFIRAFSGLTKPKVQVLGTEFAGRIESVGDSVTTFAPGDRVCGFSAETRFGAHAEYMTMRETGMIANTPAHMSCEQIAPATEGAHYALNNIRAAKVRAGSRVLVYGATGATGAIGTAAVQLCKHFGAYVTAVCDTARVPLVQSLGPDAVIDCTKEDFTRTAAEAFDFVFDAVGKSTFGACKPLLKPGGIYCSTDLGRMAQNPPLVLWTRFFGDRKVIFPFARGTKNDAEFLKSLAESGAFTPVIDRTYPFDQIVEAFTYVETGQKTGNVVVTMR